GLLIFFVFPKIISIFSGFQAQLPLSTRILIAFVNFMTNYFLWLIIIFVVLAVLMWFLFKINRVKFLYHRFILMMPFIGGVARNINMTNFARTLGSLLKSGIKIVDAILITADTIPNLVYGKKLKEIAERVRGGESMSHYMIQEEKFFPAIFSQMVEVGETTGHLDENLTYLANFYEAEADEVFKNLSTVLEPILLLVMGVIVGFIAVSVITPIYKIAGGLGL
ncbi:MAG: type II secretion system F family protein, partial [Patescibacteria group bacterium]